MKKKKKKLVSLERKPNYLSSCYFYDNPNRGNWIFLFQVSARNKKKKNSFPILLRKQLCIFSFSFNFCFRIIDKKMKGRRKEKNLQALGVDASYHGHVPWCIELAIGLPQDSMFLSSFPPYHRKVFFPSAPFHYNINLIRI